MIDINELRKLAQAATPGPWIVNSTAINELLDRLEESESDALEQARLNGMGSEREAALLSKMEAAEKARDQFRADWFECLALAEEAKPIIDRQRSEIDALRARIEQMEKQEPVYLFRRKGLDYFCTCSKERYESFSAKPRLFEVKTLYALPGAKGEENEAQRENYTSDA